jgi:hypothetical protein
MEFLPAKPTNRAAHTYHGGPRVKLSGPPPDREVDGTRSYRPGNGYLVRKWLPQDTCTRTLLGNRAEVLHDIAISRRFYGGAGGVGRGGRVGGKWGGLVGLGEGAWGG